MTATDLAALGYYPARQLPSGEWIGIRPMLYTWDLFAGLDRTGYRTRFCFADESEAKTALEAWDGNGSPPGFWKVQKPQDIQGPGSTV